MGHLGHLKAEHADLVERLDAGAVGLPQPITPQAQQGWREILEILYEPQEAELATKLPVLPSSIGVISKRAGLSEEECEKRLNKMADKGIVVDLIHPDTGKRKYLLSPPVVGFFEFSLMRVKDSIPKKRMAEALDAYCHGDASFANEVFAGDTVLGRAMVHESSLQEEQLPDVLHWERSTQLIEEAKTLAVSYCYCRHKTEHMGKRCDAPMDVCLSLNGGAEFVVRREFGSQIDRSEASDILHECRDRGLVQIADNVQNRPTYICNCCGCCCGQLSAINEYDLPAVNPSGYWAISDAQRCKGCSKCSRACPVGAISMLPHRQDGNRKNKLYPEINRERCIGCGVCVPVCGNKRAMNMVRRPKSPYVPHNSIEKTLRMAIERGRLAHLLIDQGASRGHRFMNKLLQGILRLPLVDRAVANRQLQSRFIEFAMGFRSKSPRHRQQPDPPS